MSARRMSQNVRAARPGSMIAKFGRAGKLVVSGGIPTLSGMAASSFAHPMIAESCAMPPVRQVMETFEGCVDVRETGRWPVLRNRVRIKAGQLHSFLVKNLRFQVSNFRRTSK